MKNFTNRKDTLTIALPKEAKFEKCSEYVGSYDKGQMAIMGYLKTLSKKYNKYQFSLVIQMYQDEKPVDLFLMNVPEWYGSKLEEDFMNTEQTAAEYFSDAWIKKIESFETKFQTDSYNIIIY